MSELIPLIDVNQDSEEIDSQFPSRTFCALPWVHISTRPNGHMRVCCTANASAVSINSDSSLVTEDGLIKKSNGLPATLANTSLSEAWNNDYMKNIRLKMLNGEQPESCSKCFKEESAGHRSKRMWETRKWIRELGIDNIVGGTNPDGSIPPEIRYLDLRLGSKCQLACIMCSPNDSSGWIKEHKIIYKELENPNLRKSMAWEKDDGRLEKSGATYAWHKNNPEFWSELLEQIPNLKQLYFAGGEALIIEEHYELLQKIVDDGYAKDIELRYNSNGLEWDDNLFDLWKEFKYVIFHFSIDDIEDRLNFMRYPTEWNHCRSQLHKLDNYPHGNLKLTTAYTVTALNIYYIPEFLKWKLSENFKLLNKYPVGAGLFSCHLAYWPPQLNVKVLPKHFKEKVSKKYEEFYNWLDEHWELCMPGSKEEWLENESGIKRLKGLVSFMNADDWSNRLTETAEWCYKVSEMRDIDFNEVYKEMAWLEGYYV